jgi:probable F420-dependent oxidoreductase
VKFAYGLPFLSCPPNPAFVSGDALGTLGRAAEGAGFHATYATDHPAPSEAWRAAGGHDALDPFVALAFVGAATSDLRLMTYLTIVPYRNPFVLAKAVATLDALSAGRVILGVGTGYMKSEFAALNADFDQRNAQFDEYLDVMKRAWTGEPVVYEGIFVTAKGNTAQPPPAQQPHPPIWLGGNSKLTRRRAAEWGQGWMPMPNSREQVRFARAPALETLDDLAEMLDYLRAHAASVGRTDPIEIMYVLPGHEAHDDPAAQLDLAQRLAELGVTWLAVNGEGETVTEARDFAFRMGEQILAPLA